MPPLELQPRPETAALIARTMVGLGERGAFFNGAERVALAETARNTVGRTVQIHPIPDPFAEAVRLVAGSPAALRREMVDRWATEDLDRLSYIELVSVVARVAAIDAYCIAIQLEYSPLPTDPSTALPTANAHRESSIVNAWVPTVGRASALTALSAVPSEADAQLDVHRVFYLDGLSVLDFASPPPSVLSRPQIELVAARTSYLNECFY